EPKQFPIVRLNDEQDITIADRLCFPAIGHDAAESTVEKIVRKNAAIALLPAPGVNGRDCLAVRVAPGTNVHSSSNAATPGSVRPSIHSRNAPPAVETKVKSSATPA